MIHLVSFLACMVMSLANPSGADELAAIEAKLDRGEYQAAIAALDEILKREPQSANALALRASANYFTNNPEQARRDIDDAFKLNPASCQVLTVRGFLEYQWGNLDSSFVCYTKAIEISPSEKLYLSRGSLNLRMSHFEKAVADYSEAIRLDPKSQQGYASRGEAYFRLNEIEKALADFEHSIKLDPNSCLGYWGRARLHYEKKQYDDAIIDSSKAIQRKPGHDEFYLFRARAYYAATQFEEALDDINYFIKKHEKHSEALLLRVKIHIAMNHPEKVIQECDRAIQLFPEDEDFYFGRSLAYYAIDDPLRGAEDYKKYEELIQRKKLKGNARQGNSTNVDKKSH